MDLQGKKVNFLGDSITKGHGVADPENIYLNRVKRMLGLAEARNYGISGTRFAPSKHVSGDPKHDQDFISRVDLMDADADAVVVFGGTNDFGHGHVPLGTPDDRTVDTFYGAADVLMRKLIERYPGKPIVFMTPLHRCNEDSIHGDGPSVKPQADHALVDYVAAIKTVAARYSLPILDLWSISGLQPKIPVIKEKYVPDGLHPNDDGQAIVADRVAGFLKAL